VKREFSHFEQVPNEEVNENGEGVGGREKEEEDDEDGGEKVDQTS
jgi:hypothetical protein